MRNVASFGFGKSLSTRLTCGSSAVYHKVWVGCQKRILRVLVGILHTKEDEGSKTPCWNFCKLLQPFCQVRSARFFFQA